MKNNIALIAHVVAVVAVMVLLAWVTSEIWNSDMPDWLKWLILR